MKPAIDNSPEGRQRRRELINPMVRANLGQPDDETRSLIPEEYRAHYDAIMQELGAAGMAKVQADERYTEAARAHHGFMGELLIHNSVHHFQLPAVTELRNGHGGPHQTN